MSCKEDLSALVRLLLAEDRRYDGAAVPQDPEDLWRLYRTLVNLRPPRPADAGLLRIQDRVLLEVRARRGVTGAAALPGRVSLWRGDITTLACGAIVNAANSGLLGCFVPCHRCIDNAIHTYAGIQLRLACAGLTGGRPEPTGRAQITPGFNLPARYVLHTVGPIVDGPLTPAHRAQLRACYRSCLETAEAHGLDSVAFCCISTGEFRFPRRPAAEIAVETVADYLKSSAIQKVVFNVFQEEDEAIYAQLLE